MKKVNIKYIAIAQAIIAAILFGLSAPFSKIILEKLSPYLLSSLLYLGAGFGMLIIDGIRKIKKMEHTEARLTINEFPYITLMILLDIVAPILLLFGLKTTNASSASLLYNFEIVATALIALLLFKEGVGKRLWFSIILITISSIILSVNNFNSFSFSLGSILVLLGCFFWGLENNVTRKLSIKDPLQIVIIKGIGAGTGAIFIAIFLNELVWNFTYILFALVLGFFAYGLSIFFYVTAQRQLGASRTSTYYAFAPFIGVILSFIIYQDSFKVSFIIALIIMVTGAYFAINEKHIHKHIHEYIEHEHKHSHDDGHHDHTHGYEIKGEHSHFHIHEHIEHTHEHTPDIHHGHSH